MSTVRSSIALIIPAGRKRKGKIVGSVISKKKKLLGQHVTVRISVGETEIQAL